MAALVLLLRGINVGTAKQVGMADLKAALEQPPAGYEGVRTHLRSGNVVMRAPDDASPEEVARDVERRIERRFGFDVAVVVRTRDELAATVQADPLGEVADNPSRHLVAFLDVKPPRALLEALRGAEVAPERFAVVGRDIHLWLPGGVTGSPLSKLLTPKRAGGTVTVRNWATATKLLELASADG